MPTFAENIAAVVDAIGTEHVGIVWGLGSHPWDSAEDRDAVLAAITSQRVNLA